MSGRSYSRFVLEVGTEPKSFGFGQGTAVPEVPVVHKMQ